MRSATHLLNGGQIIFLLDNPVYYAHELEAKRVKRHMPISEQQV